GELRSVFRPDTDPHQVGGDRGQLRKAGQDAHQLVGSRRLAGIDRPRHHRVQKALQRLDDRRWELAPALDSSQVLCGDASGVAPATASWTARLMPPPPAGDMACAASPMHNSPFVYQRRSRLSRISKSLTSSIDSRPLTASDSSGMAVTMSRRSASI